MRNGKNIVFICRNEEDLCEAFKKIKSEKILLQQYIEKTDEQSYEGFSVNHGKNVFFSVQNNEVYHLKDKYAPFWRNKKHSISTMNSSLFGTFILIFL